MCKKSLVLAVGLLCGANIAIAEESVKEINKPNEEKLKFTLQQCADKFLGIEENILKHIGSKKIENLAVIIGNQNYTHQAVWSSLKITHDDAKAIKDKFSENGFYVLHRNDATKIDLDRLVCKMGFILKHQPVQTVAFFYSGHGLQDMLIPKDMKTAEANDPNGFRIDNIVEIMKETEDHYLENHPTASRNHLVLLDACRDSSGNGKGGKRISKGPMSMNGESGVVNSSPRIKTGSRPKAIAISYSADISQSSYENLDKENKGYSFYTEALKEHLFNKSVSVKTAFNNIRQEVEFKTKEYVKKLKEAGEADEKDEAQRVTSEDGFTDFFLVGQQKLNPTVSN